VQRATVPSFILRAVRSGTECPRYIEQRRAGIGARYSVSDPVVESDAPDPPSDRLCWENGVWANATLSVDQSDGITGAELEAVVALARSSR
jgi:hypothetical protein